MHKYCGFFVIFCFVFAIGNASDARLTAMGNLGLLFQDDLHKLDLYDFAGISAGFFRNDTTSNVVLRASGLKESWKDVSLDYLAIGQAIPDKLIEYAPVQAVSFYQVIPQFSLVPCEILYRSRSTKETYDMFGNPQSPQSWGVHAGYSQLSQTRTYTDTTQETDVVRTPSLAFIYAKPISKNIDFGVSGDGFYSMYNSADNTATITLAPFGGGTGLSFNNNKLGLGINVEYHYPMFNYEGPLGSEKFSGHAISPTLGTQVRFANIIWVGAVDYKWVNLSGSSNGADMGDLKIDGVSGKTHILFCPSFIRFAGFGHFGYSKPVYTSANDNIWYETSFKDYEVGGGLGVGLAQARGGAEVVYTGIIADDLINNQSDQGNSIIIRIGGEVEPVKSFFARAGYNFNQVDPDVEQSDDLSIINTVTGGLGINLIENTRIDFGYNYKWARTDLNPDEKITDHIFFLYLLHTLGREEF